MTNVVASCAEVISRVDQTFTQVFKASGKSNSPFIKTDFILTELLNDFYFREEWQWLQTLDSLKVRLCCSSRSLSIVSFPVQVLTFHYFYHYHFIIVQEGTQEPSKTAHEFQVLVAKAAETLMEKVGVNKEVVLKETHKY